MKDTMALIEAVLLDAEQKRSQNNALKEWLRYTKHVFSDAEDIVDDFECEALQKRVVDTHGSISEKVVAYDRFAFVGLEIIGGDTRVVHVIRETTHSHVIETR
ncbi:hypothetical protein glysoja_017383 [Glycine soja]|nr:hypothetical protein glysoja_017383 [Glycine soja]